MVNNSPSDLLYNVPISRTQDGRPTAEFMRLWNQQSRVNIDVATLVTDVANIQAVDLIAGVALSGGGNISGPTDLTFDLDDTAVVPGAYTFASITVDQQGRLTAASSGGAPYDEYEFIVFQSDFEGADAQTTFVGMDDSLYNHKITAISTAHITTSLAEFNTSSLDVRTSGEAVRVSACADEFDIGSGAFFIEFFLAISSTGGNAQLMGIGATANGDALFKVQQSNTGSAMRFFYSTDGTTWTEPLSTWTVSAFNVFRHTLIVRDAAGNLSTYIEGVRDDTVVDGATFFTSLADLIIGGGSETILTGRGRFDGVRMGIGTTGGYDPTASTITVPAAYYGEAGLTTDIVRQGATNQYYCRNTALEDFSLNIDAASNIAVTFSEITKKLTLTADDQLEALSSTQGAVAFRGAAAWEALAPGTDEQVLTTKGAAANPEWGDALSVSPHLSFLDAPLTIYRINDTVGENPRTAIVSSVASDVITITTPTSGSFWGSQMDGNCYIRIWNTTKSPDESAWVKAAPLTTTLQVTDAADIVGWVNTDVIQIGDPVAEQIGRVMSVDVSLALAANEGIKQAEGYLVAGGIAGASVNTDALDITPAGVSGTFISTAKQGGGGDGTTTFKVGPLSPISDSNLILIREGLTTTSTIRLMVMHGVYQFADASSTFDVDNESIARDWFGL